MADYIWQKILLWVSFIFFLGSLLLRQETAINQDLGRHLRLGEMIVAGGEARKCALFTNCLTYTYPEYPFVNHHWGSEVIFSLTYKFAGFNGLILLKTLILGLAFTVTVRHASRPNSSAMKPFNHATIRNVVAIVTIFLSIQMMADRLTARPEIFGYLLFSLLFWILNKSYIDDKRPARLNAKAFDGSLLIYIAPAIILLWVNLHISFVFGLILVWIWTISAILKGLTLASAKVSPYQVLVIPAVSTLVTVLNPSGHRGALMPLSIMKDYGYTVVENMTPFFLSAFKPQPEYTIFAFLLAITIVLIITPSLRLPLFLLLSLGIFSVFPLIAVRHLPFFALLVPVGLTPLISNLLKGFSLTHVKENPYQKLPVLAAGGIFFAAIINPIPLAYTNLPEAGLTSDKRHQKAVEFVKEQKLEGNIWNNYDIGSFLEWAIREHPAFVDGRPEAYPAGFFKQTYIPMQENKEVWDKTTRESDIQWVFAALTDATPWFAKWWNMIQRHDGWRIVYLDESTVIVIRRNGPNDRIEPERKAKISAINKTGLP